jgi:four helix bundle protein
VKKFLQGRPAFAEHGPQLSRRGVLGTFARIGNIAEGVGQKTTGANKYHVRIARGSLYETKHWLRRAYRRDLLSDGQVDALKPLLDELAPRLNAYLNSIGR